MLYVILIHIQQEFDDVVDDGLMDDGLMGDGLMGDGLSENEMPIQFEPDRNDIIGDVMENNEQSRREMPIQLGPDWNETHNTINDQSEKLSPNLTVRRSLRILTNFLAKKLKQVMQEKKKVVSRNSIPNRKRKQPKRKVAIHRQYYGPNAGKEKRIITIQRKRVSSRKN